MDKFEAGMLAKSKAGHDTGKIYVIADTDDAYVYLVDGRKRKSMCRSFLSSMRQPALTTEKSDRY